MAIYEIAASTTTIAPPACVWAVLDDFRGWPAWMPSMNGLNVDLLTAGAPRAGYQFRIGGRVVHADLEVTACSELERATSFRLSFPPLSGDNLCRIVPLAGERYRLERVDHLHLPKAFIHFLDGTRRQHFEELAREFLLALKRTSEARYRGEYVQPQQRAAS
jgi:hypothetical protein